MSQDCGQGTERREWILELFWRKMSRTFSFLSNYFGPSCLATGAPCSPGEGVAPSFLCVLVQTYAFTQLNYRV